MDISVLLEKFCEHALYFKGYSPHTIKGYKQAVKQFCRVADIENIDEVSTDNLRHLFYTGRVQYKWTSNTYRSLHKRLNMFFRWCLKNGHLSVNPLLDIEVPRLEQKLPTKLTQDASLKLLEVVYNYPYGSEFLRHRNHAIFSMVLFAGLRKKELTSLVLTDVDVVNSTIFVRQAKGAKDRVVPMSFALAKSLTRYLIERKGVKKTCPQFFVSSNRNMGLTDIGLRNLVRQIREASGIQFSLHKLRHTFATLMLEGGCDIYSLSKMMGHTDIKTTTIYLYASAFHLRSQMEKHPLNSLENSHLKLEEAVNI